VYIGLRVMSWDRCFMGVIVFHEVCLVLCIKQYSSKDPPKMVRAPKIASQKKQPISMLRDKRYLTYIALTLLNPDIVHKTMQQL